MAELAGLAELATVPAPARAADDLTGGTPSPAPACAAGCRVCAEAADGFGALRAGSLAQRRRFAGSGRPPYAAEKQTLHRGDCRKVEQSVGRVAGDERTAPPAEELTRFAHDGRLSPEWATHVRLLDAAEATGWVEERIGPRGGARYRLCRTCTPELP
ncbi:hypothetical protein [Streptomyces similanensis]|uniref:Uncharacterized protein n=1 Tax=Streptomyces similanensis TaxID=1274988 RepID=A0ABP9JTP1_9ACTN